MSDFRAIGGVSATLKTLLETKLDRPPGLPAAITPIPVSIGIPPPEDEVDSAPRVNLFLYRLSENGALKNQEIPGRAQGGGAYGHPPLSLDLHYLITAYGGSKAGTPPLTDERLAQYLLGSAMRVLHDHPIVTDELETAAGTQILDESLRGEYEHVKVTFEPVSLEDVSKVWTALNRPYRLSAAYEVRVTQIESRAPRRYPQRVGVPTAAGQSVTAIPVRAPRIDEVHAATQPGPYAAVGDTLVLTGNGLDGDPTLAWLGEVDASGSVTSARIDRLTILVPDDPRLQPGIQPVRVAYGLQLGKPPKPHVGPGSNTAAWVLVPSVTTVARAGAGPLVIEGTRLIASGVECVTLIGDAVVPQRSYLAGATPMRIRMQLPAGVGRGSPVRVRVNGAESLERLAVP